MKSTKADRSELSTFAQGALAFVHKNLDSSLNDIINCEVFLTILVHHYQGEANASFLAWLIRKFMILQSLPFTSFVSIFTA